MPAESQGMFWNVQINELGPSREVQGLESTEIPTTLQQRERSVPGPQALPGQASLPMAVRVVQVH